MQNFTAGRKNRVPGPVIPAVRRERPEDGLSLLEPIFHGKTLPKSLERSCRDLSRARAHLLQGAYLRGHAIYTRRYSKGYTRVPAWWRSRWKNGRFHMNAFHANAPHRRPWGTEGWRKAAGARNSRLNRVPEYRVPSTRVSSTEHRVPKFECVGWAKNSARRCGDNWVNTFRPFVP